jgi:hypothetical protein
MNERVNECAYKIHAAQNSFPSAFTPQQHIYNTAIAVTQLQEGKQGTLYEHKIY